MFQPSYIEPPSSGKKIHGLPTRREPAFSLGWDQSHQLNSYQKRKGMDQEITGKITNLRVEPKHEQAFQDDALQRQKLKQLYQRLSYQNPDIPQEQLERYVYAQQKKKIDSRQIERQQKQANFERRGPIYQKDSMKEIIFNGVGVGSQEEQRAASRQRNNSNLVLGNGYNYYQDGNR